MRGVSNSLSCGARYGVKRNNIGKQFVFMLSRNVIFYNSINKSTYNSSVIKKKVKLNLLLLFIF